MRAILDAEKEAVAEGVHENDGFCQKLPGGGLWKVHPNGFRMGEAGKGPIMRWKIERDGMRFGLTARPVHHKTNPTGQVIVSGETMLALGGSMELVYGKVKTWLAEIGLTLVEAKLSRVDMCVDLVGVGVSEFVDAYRDCRVMTLTKKSEDHSDCCLYRSGRRDTGFVLGRGTSVRIYDKVEECSQDIAKWAWMVHSRYGGVMPEAATRVEFQLRREFLKDHGVNTVEDYIAKRRAIAKFLTGRWVRFLDDSFDPRHTDRAKNLPVWDTVAALFDQWTQGSPAAADLAPIPREAVNPDALVKQARGCIETAAARMGLWIEGQHDFMEFAAAVLWDQTTNDPRLSERVQNKMNQTTAPTRGRVSELHARRELAACT